MPFTIFDVMPMLMILSMGVALWQWLRIPEPQSTVFKLFGIILLVAIPLELAGMAARYHYINNSMAYSLFGLLEACLVLGMIMAIRPRWRAVIMLGLVLVITSMVVNYLVIGTFDILLIEGILVNGVILSIFLMALLWSLANTSVRPLTGLPEFWLFTGLLIYYSGITPMFGLVPIIFADDPIMASKVFIIAPGLAMIRYLLAAWACRLARRHSPEDLNSYA
jgi:hypothetical protein